jgi:AAHS family 4-hydroxybenzoate transporter-like MFS transporter
MNRSHVIDIERLLDEGRWGGRQRLFVFLTALTVVFDGADNQLLGIAVPSMMRDWALARGAFAPILASGLIGMLIGGAIGGLVGDRLGRRIALIGSALVFGVTTAAVAIVDSLWMLGALRFVAGLGLGGAMPNAAALASEYVPRRHRPFAVTLTIVCVPLGGTLAAFVAGRLLPVFGWRALFGTGGLLTLVVVVLLIRFLPESPRYLARHPERWSDLARIIRQIGHDIPPDSTFAEGASAARLPQGFGETRRSATGAKAALATNEAGERARPLPREREETTVSRVSIGALFTPDFRRDTLALAGAFFCCLLSVYTAFNWVPSMLTGAGLDLATAGTSLAAFNLGGVAGAIGGGAVITRFGSRVTMLSMSAGAVAGTLILAAMPVAAFSTTSALPLIVMLGITGGLINAVQTTMYALAAHVYPTAIRATGVGTAVAVGRSGGVLSTYAGAWALEAGGSRAFFALMAVAMTLVAGCLALVERHIPERRRLTQPKG